MGVTRAAYAKRVLVRNFTVARTIEDARMGGPSGVDGIGVIL